MSDFQKTINRIHCREKGMALVSVLWILMLLTAIVGEFAYSMRTEVNITRNFKEATQAHYIAHAGVMRAVVEMIRNTEMADNPETADDVESVRTWRVNAPIAPLTPRDRRVAVQVNKAVGGVLNQLHVVQLPSADVWALFDSHPYETPVKG